MSIKNNVMNHLFLCGDDGDFIKPIYKALDVKERYDLSLNKFRKLLREMEQEGSIYEVKNSFPSWKLSKNKNLT